MNSVKVQTEASENSLEEDFRNAFFECFLDSKLKRTNVKKIKLILSRIGTGDLVAVKILEDNGNIKTLHSCLHNDIGLFFYLLLEEGYSLTEMSAKIILCIKKGARTSIQYWADKYYKELKITSRDPLAKGRGTYYQKKDQYMYLHELIEKAAKRILVEKKKDELQNSLPKEVFNNGK